MAKKAAAKSKSETIREYAKANPQASKNEIAKATKTSYTLVYQALGKKKKAKRGRKPVAATNGHGDPYETIKAAFNLIKTAGGLTEATQALKVASALAGTFTPS